MRVRASRIMTSAPSSIWEVVAAPLAIGSWNPGVRDVTMDHGVRTCFLGESKITERIVAIDHPSRTLRYEVVHSPVDFVRHAAQLAVRPSGQGCEVVWTAEFELVEPSNETVTAASMRRIFERSLDRLASLT